MERFLSIFLVLSFAVWFVLVIAVAASRRTAGVEKAIWVLINLMFPVLGYFAFLVAMSRPVRTLRDIVANR